MSQGDAAGGPARHIPVLLQQTLEALAPRDGGAYIDGTFGGGGYARALLAAADCRVVAIDRDPTAIAAGTVLAAESGGRLTLVEGRFSVLDRLAAEQGVEAADGVTMDVGVSSMQVDDPARGFSFLRDGPLDMRMGSEGQSAAEVVNTLPEADLAIILKLYGEERRSRAVARAIVRARPIATTGELAGVVADTLGPSRDGRHPATRTFQALRIYVNDELDELAAGLGAAERALKPGGRLAVVTFHSLEDRLVKRFLTERTGGRGTSRHLPEAPSPPATFKPLLRQGQTPDEDEIAANPRARSARLRAAERTGAPARPVTAADLGTRRPVLSGRVEH